MNKLIKHLPNGLIAFFSRYFRNTIAKRYGNPKKIQISAPLSINPRFIKIEDYVRIQNDVHLITSEAKLFVKKYTAIGAGCYIIPGSHIPTVGVPQYLSILHINDAQRGITINEDCWVGAESMLLSKCCIGRGVIVAARSVVTKDIPPYAVVAGNPAKIIATRFTIEQIIEHEKLLYPQNERLSYQYLEDLFKNKYTNLKAIGTSSISDSDLQVLNKAKKDLGMYMGKK